MLAGCVDKTRPPPSVTGGWGRGWRKRTPPRRRRRRSTRIQNILIEGGLSRRFAPALFFRPSFVRSFSVPSPTARPLVRSATITGRARAYLFLRQIKIKKFKKIILLVFTHTLLALFLAPTHRTNNNNSNNNNNNNRRPPASRFAPYAQSPPAQPSARGLYARARADTNFSPLTTSIFLSAFHRRV